MPNLDTTNTRRFQDYNVHESADGLRIHPGPYIGIVKANMDRKRSGRLQVYIPEMGGDPSNDACWKGVDFCPPFYNITPPFDQRNSPPQSSGMWFTPPDVGVSVMCVFVNGDPARGYWIGCIPDWPHMHMIPGISHPIDYSSPDPVLEWNDKGSNPDAYSTFFVKQNVPHEYQKKRYEEQGINKDEHRNSGTSSAHRESPSRVFGISTPGPPKDPTPRMIPYDEKNNTYEIFYPERLGGHTFVMDDGDFDGTNRKFKLRTTAGHTIQLHDEEDKEFIYIINHNGKAWVEIDKEGDVYVYSQRDIKLTAKRDMFMEVGRSFRLKAETIDIESRQYIRSESNQITSLSHQHTKITAEGGLHLRGAEVWLNSEDMINIYGHGDVIVVGALVLINSGNEQDAEQAPKAKLPLKMPDHEPWPYHLDNGGDGGDYSFDPKEGFEGPAQGVSVSPNDYSAANGFGGGAVNTSSLQDQNADQLTNGGANNGILTGLSDFTQFLNSPTSTASSSTYPE